MSSESDDKDYVGILLFLIVLKGTLSFSFFNNGWLSISGVSIWRSGISFDSGSCLGDFINLSSSLVSIGIVEDILLSFYSVS